MKKIIIAFSLLFSVNAFAIDQMYNWGGLEFVTSGNATHVHPASPESTRLRGGWVVEFPEDQPEIRAKHQLPYKNKGGAGAVIEVRPKVDPSKVAAKAKDAIKAGAAGLASGGGYLALASITCTLLCDAAIEALKGWGVDKLLPQDDGTFAVSVPDTSDKTYLSTGTGWRLTMSDYIFYSPDVLCLNVLDWPYGPWDAVYAGWEPDASDSNYAWCVAYGFSPTSGTVRNYRVQRFMKAGVIASCPAGTPVGIDNSCPASVSYTSADLGGYLNSKYTGEGWSHHWAKMTAKVIEEGGNVFTDGTSVGITGPALVPLTVTERKTGVRLLPNTTTIAPSTYDGPTESGTQTETTTTSAKNIYQSAPFGQNTGPSVKTSTQAQTVTTITNNVTNVTNIVNETTTETDEAPEETVSDSPMPDLPELYEQKYKDGLTGVVTAKIAELKQTPLFQLPSSLMGDLPSSGQCPSWQLDLNLASWANFGIHSIGADCAIWDFAALVVLISAAILCRALIFGG